MTDTTPIPHANENLVLADLRGLLAKIQDGVNSNDQCIVMISAAIAEGFDTRKRIVDTLEGLSFHRVQVVKILGYYEGTNSTRARWTVHEDGHYTLLE